MRVWREFTFEAAHFLPGVPEGHKCGRTHGHGYRVRVELEGPVQTGGPERGMVLDFARIDSVKTLLDHTNLNDMMENPTSENLAEHIALHLGALCQRVTVSETESSGAEWVRP